MKFRRTKTQDNPLTDITDLITKSMDNWVTKR